VGNGVGGGAPHQSLLTSDRRFLCVPSWDGIRPCCCSRCPSARGSLQRVSHWLEVGCGSSLSQMLINVRRILLPEPRNLVEQGLELPYAACLRCAISPVSHSIQQPLLRLMRFSAPARNLDLMDDARTRSFGPKESSGGSGDIVKIV
jgi:hypothetical protein